MGSADLSIDGVLDAPRVMISETFPPFNWSGSQRPFQFAKYLPEYGYLPERGVGGAGAHGSGGP